MKSEEEIRNKIIEIEFHIDKLIKQLDNRNNPHINILIRNQITHLENMIKGLKFALGEEEINFY